MASAARISSALAAKRASQAAPQSGAPTTWIWAIMRRSVDSAVKPPASRTILAMWEAEATTEGSSMAMGTR
ncbi:hypothetical protein D3C72_586640 [compost metagenome]